MARKLPPHAVTSLEVNGRSITKMTPGETTGDLRGIIIIVEVENHADRQPECLNRLSEVLVSNGNTVVRASLPIEIDDAIDHGTSIVDAVVASCETPVRPVGLTAMGLAAGVAAVIASRRSIQRLCLLGPVAPELLARRQEAGREESAHDHIRSLASHGPLKCFVGHRGAALVVRGASDTVSPAGHALAYSAAREYAQRAIEMYQIAFADHDFSDPDSSQALQTVVVEFFRAMNEVEAIAS